jgi:hypothetical protein
MSAFSLITIKLTPHHAPAGSAIEPPLAMPSRARGARRPEAVRVIRPPPSEPAGRVPESIPVSDAAARPQRTGAAAGADSDDSDDSDCAVASRRRLPPHGRGGRPGPACGWHAAFREAVSAQRRAGPTHDSSCRAGPRIKSDGSGRAVLSARFRPGLLQAPRDATLRVPFGVERR